MVECEVCGEDAERVVKCISCGINFCEYCGSITDRICIDCYEDEDLDDDEEEDNWEDEEDSY